MPLFNAANTVLVAMASLQAQTYENWECVIVDDGSDDSSALMVNTVRDARIHYRRLDRNRGRGYARQRGLEAARGRYITFLDADDWIYPDKFRQQVELFHAEPDLAILSTGMAITDANDQLIGLRTQSVGARLISAPKTRLIMPPMAFAPSMIVADLAKNIGFDSSFPITEDVDFLLRALPGNQYAILPAPLYVYREQCSTTIEKVSSALTYCCRMFEKQSAQFPLGSMVEIAKARGKQAAYRAASICGLWDYVLARRSRAPSAVDRRQYLAARLVVSKIAVAYTLTV